MRHKGYQCINFGTYKVLNPPSLTFILSTGPSFVNSNNDAHKEADAFIKDHQVNPAFCTMLQANLHNNVNVLGAAGILST